MDYKKKVKITLGLTYKNKKKERLQNIYALVDVLFLIFNNDNVKIKIDFEADITSADKQSYERNDL